MTRWIVNVIRVLKAQALPIPMLSSNAEEGNVTKLVIADGIAAANTVAIM